MPTSHQEETATRAKEEEEEAEEKTTHQTHGIFFKIVSFQAPSCILLPEKFCYKKFSQRLRIGLSFKSNRRACRRAHWKRIAPLRVRMDCFLWLWQYLRPYAKHNAQPTKKKQPTQPYRNYLIAPIHCIWPSVIRRLFVCHVFWCVFGNSFNVRSAVCAFIYRQKNSALILFCFLFNSFFCSFFFYSWLLFLFLFLIFSTVYETISVA